ncbi:MAG: transporter ATP-binding protein [Ramlibacter sp.]|nr:transporter ATP-binding protein [Ramlibacter sp.]
MSTPLLQVRGLTKRFGALVVTDDVHLEVAAGEVHAVIGPNGAGKSCLIGQITGELLPDQGSVSFNGAALDKLPVHRRAQAGLVRAYQVPQLFASFTVRGNASIPAIAAERCEWRWWLPASDVEALNRRSGAALEMMGIEPLAERPSAALGHGEKRELELAMGFATQAQLLLLDEPLAGLGPGESERLVRLLRTLKGRYAMLLVEHDMKAVFSLADRVSVLVAGRIIASGTPAQIQGDPAVRTAYLGGA